MRNHYDEPQISALVPLKTPYLRAALSKAWNNVSNNVKTCAGSRAELQEVNPTKSPVRKKIFSIYERGLGMYEKQIRMVTTK